MMDRRQVLASGALGALATALPLRAFASEAAAGARSFVLTTRVELASAPAGANLTVPLLGTYGAQLAGDKRLADGLAAAALPDGSAYTMASAPVAALPATLLVQETVTVADRAGGDGATITAEERALYTLPRGTAADGALVAQHAAQITQAGGSDRQRARAIYDWVVANTFRDNAVAACGMGDAALMLREGRMGGKCADINSLMVCLARASGIPAREQFGLRLAPSRVAAAMGATSPDVSGGQHCRAEVWLEDAGWTPVDPADVRKVMLGENLTLDTTRAQEIADKLFGWSEGNWAMYNTGRDLALGGPFDFLMYPTLSAEGGSVTWNLQSQEVTA